MEWLRLKNSGAKKVVKPPIRLKFAALLVAGWPFGMPGDPSKGQPPSAHDAAFGRLACPSLTRLSLKERKSEPLLLRSVEVESSKQWKLTLKSDLYWWSGKPVTGRELAQFVSEEICAAARAALGKDMSCPKHEVRDVSESSRGAAPSVRVIWQSQPSFGPYVLNEVPLARSTGESGFECAGLYRYRFAATGNAELIPSPGYQQKRAAIQIQPVRDARLASKAQLDFTFGSTMQTGQSCAREALVPSVMGILWNDHDDRATGGVALPAPVRKALTQLLPRGELLRAGALGLGELVTSFIPRQHPGYNPALRIRPYSVDEASAALEKAGWQRTKADSPRVDKKSGKPVVLRFLLQEPDTPGADLLQKVIGDSLALLGIQSEFISRDSGSVDGVIGNFAAEWPAWNLLQSERQKGLAKRFGESSFFLQSDVQQLARHYSHSLTTAFPDFTVMQRLHEKLYEAELFSPIFQMGSCLDRSVRAPVKLDFTDPDWLRLLVL